MAMYAQTLGATRYNFADLKTLLAKASAPRSGDRLAGLAAETERERIAARFALADLPLPHFLEHHVIPYDADDVTRLIIDTHDASAFAAIRHLTVGDFRNWLLATTTTTEMLAAVAPGITPEMASAVCRLMQNQDLIAVARKCRVITRFRTTIGLPGRLAIRLQPNHPTDDAKGIAASMLDGLFYGCGDAVIGINPAKDNLATVTRLLQMMDDFRIAYDVPMQSCVLTHLTTTLEAISAGAPVDLVFQSIGGTEATNSSFGISLAMLQEGYEAGLALRRGAAFADGEIGDNVMYFETGQGSSLSANANHGVDQQTCEARAYAVARHYRPLLVNSVVGFIGPEYLYDGKQVIRAGLEDHFCGKLLGLPMGCDVCYTNHAEVDQNDMDTLLTMLGVAGVNFVMGVPGADDIMLGYQSTSFHDALYLRQVLGLKRAPEFESWLERIGITDEEGALRSDSKSKLQKYQAQIESETSSQEAGARVAQITYLRDGFGASDSSSIVTQNPWQKLQHFTHARIALGRTGDSLPTQPALEFQSAHAEARDAVHHFLDTGIIQRELHEAGFESILVTSNASDRSEYLRRPDLGRTLSPASNQLLQQLTPAAQPELVFVIADGLCSNAIHHHAVQVLVAFKYLNASCGVAPIIIATQARVAIGDEIGALLGAKAVAVLIGERPGLSSSDSLGIYLTWRPRPGLTDADRNCISNIHAQGLDPGVAAQKLAALLDGARLLGGTGTQLHDKLDESALEQQIKRALGS
jgi:ethanolamine ammonia-lyase large subunit